MATNTIVKSAVIHTRVEPTLKKKSEKVLKKLGLSTSEFISMTLSQLVMQQGLPFEARIPNAETEAVLKESKGDYKAGRLKSYNSSTELFDELEAEFRTEKNK